MVDFGAFRASDLVKVDESFGKLPPNTTLFGLIIDGITGRRNIDEAEIAGATGSANINTNPVQTSAIIANHVMATLNSISSHALNAQSIYSNSNDTKLWVEIDKANKVIQPTVAYLYTSAKTVWSDIVTDVPAGKEFSANAVYSQIDNKSITPKNGDKIRGDIYRAMYYLDNTVNEDIGGWLPKLESSIELWKNDIADDANALEAEKMLGQIKYIHFVLKVAVDDMNKFIMKSLDNVVQKGIQMPDLAVTSKNTYDSLEGDLDRAFGNVGNAIYELESVFSVLDCHMVKWKDEFQPDAANVAKVATMMAMAQIRIRATYDSLGDMKWIVLST